MEGNCQSCGKNKELTICEVCGVNYLGRLLDSETAEMKFSKLEKKIEELIELINNFITFSPCLK